MNKITTWQNWLDSGELEGYSEDYINTIDADVAAEYPCINCGSQCIGFGRRNGRGSYRAFSQCVDCGHTVEF